MVLGKNSLMGKEIPEKLNTLVFDAACDYVVGMALAGCDFSDIVFAPEVLALLYPFQVESLDMYYQTSLGPGAIVEPNNVFTYILDHYGPDCRAVERNLVEEFPLLEKSSQQTIAEILSIAVVGQSTLEIVLLASHSEEKRSKDVKRALKYYAHGGVDKLRYISSMFVSDAVFSARKLPTEHIIFWMGYERALELLFQMEELNVETFSAESIYAHYLEGEGVFRNALVAMTIQAYRKAWEHSSDANRAYFVSNSLSFETENLS